MSVACTLALTRNRASDPWTLSNTCSEGQYGLAGIRKNSVRP